jgi:hypothetical protein
VAAMLFNILQNNYLSKSYTFLKGIFYDPILNDVSFTSTLQVHAFSMSLLLIVENEAVHV